MITQSKLKELFHYDPDSGIFTWKVKTSNRIRIGEPAGCVGKNNGYVSIRVLGKLYLAHRLAWLYMTGSFPDNCIDHINRNKTDNRFCNLRDVNHSLNAKNIEPSEMRGIAYNPSSNKWYARIDVNNKRIHLGTYTTIEDAINARKQNELKYFGQTF